MESSLLRVSFVCALTGVTLGCNQPPLGTGGAGVEPSANPAQSVVTEHHFSPPLSAKDTGKAVGSDCSEHGADSCASRLCIHTSASRHSGYVCSTACAGNENCPVSWRCARTYPTENAAFCVPTDEQLPN